MLAKWQSRWAPASQEEEDEEEEEQDEEGAEEDVAPDSMEAVELEMHWSSGSCSCMLHSSNAVVAAGGSIGNLKKMGLIGQRVFQQNRSVSLREALQTLHAVKARCGPPKHSDAFINGFQ